MLIQAKVKDFKGPAPPAKTEGSPKTFTFNQKALIKRDPYWDPVNTTLKKIKYIFWCCSPTRAKASSFTRYLDRTQRHTTGGRAPLDE